MVSKIIPFYGAAHPDLFEIERRCMDRAGILLAHLARALPDGRVLDIGAGNGFTARRLTSASRCVVPLEPAPGMIDSSASSNWVRGLAQELPFRHSCFSAAYATFAYFFPGYYGFGDEGLREAQRVVARGGMVLMADNAGDDELSALLGRDLSSDPEWWRSRGFSRELLTTAFEFDSVEEGERLFGVYWEAGGRPDGVQVKQTVEMRVAVYTRSFDRLSAV